ncbi:MAG TPA: hypothetical protein VFO95_14230 [Gemmatimonadales bacterium]|nr:hypothetical protein [Gemmatimonadales bacterium]
MSPRRRSERGVPALRNEDVTGMTDPRQDAVVRESGTAPDRGDAARELLDEQRHQAGDTPPSAARRGAPRVPEGGTDGPGQGSAAPGTETELEKHWDPENRKSS